MATLLEQLDKELPSVLPATPGKAVNGTTLMGLIRSKLIGDYADASIRQHFSRMAADSTSVIAKVDSGHGYYLRRAPSAQTTSAAAPSAHQAEPPTKDESPEGIDTLPEE